MTGASEHATDPVFSAEVAALEGAGTLLAPNLLGDGQPGYHLVPTRSSCSHPPPPSPQEPGRSSSHREGGPSCQSTPVTTLNSEPHSPCCERHLASPDSPGRDVEPGQVPSTDSDSWCSGSTRPDSTSQGVSLSEPRPQQIQNRAREVGGATQMASPHLPPSPGKDERRPASPRYFLGSMETVSVRILCLPLGSNPAFPPCGHEHSLPAPVTAPRAWSSHRERAEPREEQRLSQAATAGSRELYRANLGCGPQAEGPRCRLQGLVSDSPWVLLIHMGGSLGRQETVA